MSNPSFNLDFMGFINLFFIFEELLSVISLLSLSLFIEGLKLEEFLIFLMISFDKFE